MLNFMMFIAARRDRSDVVDRDSLRLWLAIVTKRQKILEDLLRIKPGGPFNRTLREVAEFLAANFGRLHLYEAVAECERRFGPERTPSRSAIDRFRGRLRARCGQQYQAPWITDRNRARQGTTRQSRISAATVRQSASTLQLPSLASPDAATSSTPSRDPPAGSPRRSASTP